MGMHDQVIQKNCAALQPLTLALYQLFKKKKMKTDNNSSVLCPVNQYDYLKASDNNKKTGMIWNSYKPFKTVSYLLHSIAIHYKYHY